MMPSQFLDEIPADLIDWKRKEAGMERMRSGWRANASHDFGAHGGWNDDEFDAPSSFGGSSYGSRSSYGSASSYGSRSTYGSGVRGSAAHAGKVTTRRAPVRQPAQPASSLKADNHLRIEDFAVGDKVTHDKFGLGTVVDAQDKGRNSVLTVDFGSSGVKRLMLRVAPIEKL